MAEQLLGRRPAETPSYTRLTHDDHERILHLYDGGMTLTAIAEQLNRSISTIHEVVKLYTPTLDQANRRLKASALDMAEHIIRKGSAETKRKVLAGYGIAAEQEQGSRVQVLVGISLPGLPIGENQPTFACSTQQLSEGKE